MVANNTSVGPPPTPPLVFTSDVSLSAYTVSLRTYLDAHPELDAVAVGAVVFSAFPTQPADTARDHVLLIQRAAHDSMPLRWEVPGGACDPEDKSILHGLGRELWEESGLILTAVRAQIGGVRVFFTRRNLRVGKFTFEAKIQHVQAARDGNAAGTEPFPAVTLDPNEHQAYLWATEDECRAHRKGSVELVFTTKEEEEAILEAFRVRRERRDAEAEAQHQIQE